jgi:hypothetical protein
MAKRHIIIDRVTDQVLSWFEPNKWDAGINWETKEVIGNPYTFGPKHLAEEVVELLSEGYKNEPGGINFEILEVNVELSPRRVTLF